jgi:hypothetical protein
MSATPRVCAYCDRATFMVVRGEPRCDWHVIPSKLPLKVRANARDRGRMAKVGAQPKARSSR